MYQVNLSAEHVPEIIIKYHLYSFAYRQGDLKIKL